MRLVMVSDTHCMHRDIASVPFGDVLIHAGDIVSMRELDAYKDFIQWLNELPHQYKVIIPGNHDLLFEEDEQFMRQLFSSANNTSILINEEVIIEGYKFYGSPNTPEFCSWAFNVQRDQLSEYWDKIPDDTDVLITHGPLYAYGDMNKQGMLCGCESLLEAVKRIQPKVHVCGHIHEGHGSYKVAGTRTVSVNASICTGSYRPTNPPLTIGVYPG